jgi:inosine-uridine nucleoside N-ribohydrolase
MKEKINVILDVDTGSDDAIAIAAAVLGNEFNVLGITTVGGNVRVENTTDNTLRVLSCCKREDIPVYKGAALPLASTLVPWGLQAAVLPKKPDKQDGTTPVHPEHLPLPATNLKRQDTSAVVWLIDTILKSDEKSITLITLGPITNLALAMRADERIIPKIKNVIIMGGSHDTYPPTQAAEFNVWCDPEAMEIVLQSGVNITMVSLDATSHACLNKRQADRIKQIATPPAELTSRLIYHRLKASFELGDKSGTGVGAALHDVLAVGAAAHPEMLKEVLPVSCHVDLGRGFAYGETVLNRNYRHEDLAKNCLYAKSADSDMFFNWLYKILNDSKGNF